MNHVPYNYQYPYYANAPMNNYGRQSDNWTYPKSRSMQTDLIFYAHKTR